MPDTQEEEEQEQEEVPSAQKPLLASPSSAQKARSAAAVAGKEEVPAQQKPLLVSPAPVQKARTIPAGAGKKEPQGAGNMSIDKTAGGAKVGNRAPAAKVAVAATVDPQGAASKSNVKPLPKGIC